MRGPDSNDEELEAWFKRHRKTLARVKSDELKRIAPWLPIVGVPANDTTQKSDK